MAGKTGPIGLKTIEYLNKYPGASELAIARKIVDDLPHLFKNIEAARNSIRWHNKKVKKRGKLAKSPVVPRTGTYTRENPFGLPSSHALIRTPFHLPKVNNNILILSDLHFPYQDNKAITRAIKYGIEHKINTIFINGDLLDCFQLSRFEKDYENRPSTKDEIDLAKDFLTLLREIFPKAQIYYHMGNHDVRYERFMTTHSIMMKDLFGDSDTSLESRLNLINLRIHLIGDKQITHCGTSGLSIHHGHYIFRQAQSPVSPAKTISDKMGLSMVCGHTHKISEFTKIDGYGKIHTCWSSGSLCELLPDYSPMANNYTHGFAHAIIHKDDSFTVRNYRLNNGKIL